MSGHKILIELKPEVEQRLREIADHYRESISTTASRILNGYIELIRAREAFFSLNRQGDK